MAGTCEDALGALSARLGLPLEFRDGSRWTGWSSRRSSRTTCRTHRPAS